MPYLRVNPHMAMAMAIAKKQENEFWRKLKLRHKSDCCCFGWAVYAPWACYVLYEPTNANWRIILILNTGA